MNPVLVNLHMNKHVFTADLHSATYKKSSNSW